MGVFKFKRFEVDDCGCGMKICSDSVLLAAWFLPAVHEARTVLDIGTGSGVLALLAADMLPKARITGLEIDHAAARAAALNFKKSSWPQRLHVAECSFEQYKPECQTDAIISNPPYFSNGALAGNNARAAARHQSSLSYQSLLAYAAVHLAPDGSLGFISPCDGNRHDEENIVFATEMTGLKVRRLCRVATSAGKKPSRLLWHIARGEAPTETSQLEIRHTDGSYTLPYLRLVEPYYMKI